jgi:hypothetical protein
LTDVEDQSAMPPVIQRMILWKAKRLDPTLEKIKSKVESL